MWHLLVAYVWRLFVWNFRRSLNIFPPFTENRRKNIPIFRTVFFRSSAISVPPWVNGKRSLENQRSKNNCIQWIERKMKRENRCTLYVVYLWGLFSIIWLEDKTTHEWAEDLFNVDRKSKCFDFLHLFECTVSRDRSDNVQCKMGFGLIFPWWPLCDHVPLTANIVLIFSWRSWPTKRINETKIIVISLH